MSLEHLKELLKGDVWDGHIYDYSDVELTLALLQEKIDSLNSRDKEKLRVIIEVELARDLKAMQCITTKIRDEINADLAWAWRTWEKEYVAAEEWRSEKQGLQPNPYHYRCLVSSEPAKALPPPRSRRRHPRDQRKLVRSCDERRPDLAIVLLSNVPSLLPCRLRANLTLRIR